MLGLSASLLAGGTARLPQLLPGFRFDDFVYENYKLKIKSKNETFYIPPEEWTGGHFWLASVSL